MLEGLARRVEPAQFSQVHRRRKGDHLRLVAALEGVVELPGAHVAPVGVFDEGLFGQGAVAALALRARLHQQRLGATEVTGEQARMGLQHQRLGCRAWWRRRLRGSGRFGQGQASFEAHGQGQRTKYARAAVGGAVRMTDHGGNS
ncbi:hypothetical protein [Pseudomonas faucium]|uniref:hypothetical protein n=1 Tax=Pseudomonas faucium TaxID=2740518 RepID=UPI001F26E0FA|nr:hypothetical protein [Pseudomonas faucium]